MKYSHSAIPDSEIPQAAEPAVQHALDIYAGETNKIASAWSAFSDGDLDYRPHPRSSTVGEILKHQLLSERRFFGEFLDCPDPAPDRVLPAELSISSYISRLVDLNRGRLDYLAGRRLEWWLGETAFFDVRRQRIWIFWRRVLHSAHHRTQLTVYLRLLDKRVPATYGPTADVTWQGADPTNTVDAAGRR
jgi:DinB family